VAYAPEGGRDFWFSVPDSAAMAIDAAALERLLPRVDWLHVSGSTLGFGGALAAAVEAAAERVPHVSLDPNVRPGAQPEALVRLARRADVLFPSQGELELDVPGLVVETRGADGAVVNGVHVPAPAAREVDPTGAGDTFAAAFVTAYRAGADPVDAARRACAVAARSVETLGAMEAPV
jgi:sugar/nucleoside kinase (ribokinase family)